MHSKKYTVTSALPYANGPVHIGHLAGVYIPADIFVRYLRSKGEDVLFIGGSDEHGVPITIRAKKENTTPQAIVDKYHELIKQSFADLGISFDVYSRTSSKTHAETSSAFFKKLNEENKFTIQESEQYFDPKAQQFLADRYIIGTCPKCGNENAYGDQCEKCGSTLSPSELINPKSTLSGEQPILKKTKHWYLPLDQYEGFLKQWILEEHKEWKPNVYGQCKSWLDQGLQPRAVTRDLDWGVPVPAADAEGKVLYVWFDAPIGYISATKEYFINGPKKEHQANTWEDYWKKEGTQLVHFIGKDNIVFHCIIFPAMLKAEGSYILPSNVPANEFMNLEGDKISTSRNWAVWLHEYLEAFKDQQDVLRYVLCANAPESKDNDFTWRDFQARNNNELVAILGNFINRALVLTQKYFDNKVPVLGELEAIDHATILSINEFPVRIGQAIENYKFREALQHLMDLARLGNKYLAETEPWKLYKENPTRVATILNISLQLATNLATLMEPFMPYSSNRLCAMLNVSRVTWNQTGSAKMLADGHALGEAQLLFSKIEDETIELQIKKLEDTKKANELANAETKTLKENVSFDEFTKMDIRIATVIAAEKVAKTKKLLKLTLDTGIDQRTVVSGIAEHFSPDEVLGKQVCLLANLAPREIKGIESQGMILMAEDADGSLKFMQPSTLVKPGSVVG
jgi:methionyl-tRNA synthetase